MKLHFEDPAIERAYSVRYTVERTLPALRIHMHYPSASTNLDILTITKEMTTKPSVTLSNVAGVTAPLLGVLTAIIQAYMEAGNVVKVGDHVTLGAAVCVVDALPKCD